MFLLCVHNFRFIYDYTNQKQKTIYFAVDIPGQETLAYILGDYAFTEVSSGLLPFGFKNC